MLVYSAGREGSAGSAVLVLLLAMPGIMAVTIRAARRIYQAWIEPVEALVADIDRMAGGSWHFRARDPAAAELQPLAEGINHLAHQAQQQLADLRQQRRDLQVLVDTLPDPIIATDANQHITLTNAAAARLLRRTPFQLLGKTLVEIGTEPTILEMHEQALRRNPLAGNDDYAQREIRVQRNGLNLTFQAAALRLEAGGVLLVLRDISTLAAAMQMKTDFVANASHELRTPIAAIKIAFETLREVYREDPSQIERCISIVDGQIHRLEELLSDLLDLSRVESQELKPTLAEVLPADLFRSLSSAMGTMARQKQIELVFDDSRMHRPSLRTDPRLLNLALKNLVENSLKFTPPGGRVTVSIQSDENEVRVVVSDTGIGIPPEQVERVFERFYQVDPARSASAGRGTGLGLAIVKHAIAALGGKVQLTSQLGQGTTVSCILPT